MGDGTTTLTSPFSEVVSVATASVSTTLPAPTLSVVGKKTTAITIAWSSVEGATGYLFEYMPENASSYTSVTLAATKSQRQIAGLTEGELVSVRIRALGGGNVSDSDYAELTVATQQTLSVPVVALTKATEDSLAFEWDPISGAVGYKIMYIKAGDSSYTTVEVGAAPRYTIAGLAMETSYSVKVSALGDGVNYKNSAYSELKAYWTINPFKLVAPTLTATDASKDSILLHWNPVPNAAKYYVSYAPVGSSKFTTKSVSAAKNFYQIQGLSANTEYQIKTRSIAGSSEYINSTYSPITVLSTTNSAVVKTALATPTITTTATNATITATWDANPRATGYTVIYKTSSDAAYTTVNLPATETSLTITGLSPNTSYYVKARALGEGVFWSNSAYCATTTVKTLPATITDQSTYDALRAKYNDLLLPESLYDVNIIELASWTAEALRAAISTAATTPLDDIILVNESVYSLAPLDLSSDSITFEIDYQTSGSLSILSNGTGRAQIKVNDNEITFNAFDGLTQFGGFDFIDVNPEISVYQVTTTPALGVVPAAVEMQNVGMYTSSDIPIDNKSSIIARGTTPVVSVRPSANDYALLFVGGANPASNDEEFYITLVNYYYELVEEFSLDPTKIYILYADGDVTGTSYNLNRSNLYKYTLTTSDMTFATSLGTTVRAATGANLTLTLREIGNLMNANSHLFFYTEDHGNGQRGNRNDLNDYLCGWNEDITGATVRDALFQVKQGYVTCAFTQCYSGGILDDIFNPSTGELSSLYNGSAHFAGGAAANHYEYSWYKTEKGVYVGYPQTFRDALRLCKTGVEAFVYTEQNEPFSIKTEEYLPNQGVYTPYKEHPWHAGETFSIFSDESAEPLTTPTITSFTSSSNSITINWRPITKASSYTIAYAVQGESTFTEIDNIAKSATSYTIPGLWGGSVYIVQIRANGDGTTYSNSAYSDPRYIVTPPNSETDPQPLPTPTISSANATTTSITVNWGAIANRSSYKVEYKLASASAWTKWSDTITATSATITGLKSGTNYSVRVTALGDGTNYLNSAASAAKSVTTQTIPSLTTPTISSTSATTTSITVNWGAIANAKNYTVAYRLSTASDFTELNATTSTSATISGLTSGKTYVVKVRANGDGTNYTNSEYSATVNVQTSGPLPTPTISSTSATSDSITVNWGAIANAKNYIVAYKLSSATSFTTKSSSSTSYTIPNLTPGETYVIKVRANGDGTIYTNSSYSATVSVTVTPTPEPLPTPTISSTSATTTSITVNWGAIANAKNYTVAYRLSTASDFTELNATTSTSATISGLTSGKTYVVKVRANGDGTNYTNSEYSATVNVQTSGPLPTPTISSTSATSDSITVNWGAIANAKNYIVAYKLSSATSFTTKSSSSTSYTIPNLTPGETYLIKVRANGDGTNYTNSSYSSTVSVTVSPTPEPLPTPTISSISATSNSITISWDVVANAFGYTVSYSLANGTNPKSSDYSINTTSCTISGLASGTTYVVSVRANGDGTNYLDSAASATKSVTTKSQLETPTISSTVGTENSLAVGWEPVEGAASYTLAYAVFDSADYTTIGGLTSPNYTITGLETGTAYKVKVKANGASSQDDSEYSVAAHAALLPKLSRPTITSTSSSTTSITLEWGAIGNAKNYTVAYRLSSESSFTELNSTTSTSATISSLTSENTYVVKVRANGDGKMWSDSDYSYTTTIKTNKVKEPLAAPTITSYSRTTDSITLYWGTVANASSYKVSYALSSSQVSNPLSGSSNFTTISTSSRSCKISGLEPGKEYQFRVTAVAEANSGYPDASSSTRHFSTLIGTESPSTVVTTLEDVVDGTDGKISLREAIFYATDGDTITFAPALGNNKTITLNGSEIVIRKSLTIGNGSLRVFTIDGDGKSRVFSVSGANYSERANVTFKGLTIKGGYSTSNGGGVYSSFSFTSFFDCTITDNVAEHRGGGVCGMWSNLSFHDCVIANNAANEMGGGIGFAAYATQGSDNYISVDANDTLIKGNIATNGGGIALSSTYDDDPGSSTFNNCTITENIADESGGGVYGTDLATFSNCEISKNQAGKFGGGVADMGSGYYSSNIYIETIINCTITENTALDGGGVYYANSSDSQRLVNCTISKNSASNNGGGVYGNAQAINCAITENDARTSGGGLYGGGNWTNCTVAGNTSPNGSTILVKSSNNNPLRVNNSIILGGVSKSDGGALSMHSSLAEAAVWDTGAYNCLYDQTRPLFVNASSGNYALATDSQAIDKGNNAWVSESTDLADGTRIVGATVDLGAFEYQTGESGQELEQPSVVVTTVDDVVNPYDGLISLREAIQYANEGASITFASKLNNKTILLCGQHLEILKPLTVDASALSSLTIDAQGCSRVFYLDADNIELKGLTITGGKVDSYGSGGGVYARGKSSISNCTITNNHAYYGGGVNAYGGSLTEVALTNCTISGNTASGSGGGVYGGTLTDCTIGNNTASGSGGGVYSNGGTLTNCTISGNTTSGSGGGVYGGTLTNCTISGNTASNDGGGVCYGTLTNCTISNNTASNDGGGVYYGTLMNCTISDNTASNDGGGVFVSGGALTNCAITKNRATTGSGGGVFVSGGSNAALTHCTIADNTANTGSALHVSERPTYSLAQTRIYNSILIGSVSMGENALCAAYNTLSTYSAWELGDNNYAYATNQPLFTNATSGDYTLANNSQAIDKGDFQFVIDGTDLSGAPRIVGRKVDLGAYEYQLNASTYQKEQISTVVTTTADVVDPYDGLISLREAITLYASPCDVITFARVLNNKKITLRGEQLEVSKPLTVDASSLSSLTIDGAETSRVFYISADRAVLKELTITGGNANASVKNRGYGGGVYCVNSGVITLTDCTISGNAANYGGGSYYGTLTDCTISNNTANNDGGGSYYGALTNCTISNNTASFGGGSSYGTLTDCTISNNTAYSGGGSSYGTLTNCTISGNTAEYDGGGSYFGTLTNCTISGNTAEYSGGGSSYGTLTNCTISGNTANYGGGVCNGTLTNCLVTNNIASHHGCGVSVSTDCAVRLYNCTIADNTGCDDSIDGGRRCYVYAYNSVIIGKSSVAKDYTYVYNTLSTNKSWDNTDGNNTVYDETKPLFKNAAIGDYTLAPNSQAINKGDNAYVPTGTTTDLLGNTRIVGGTVDLGCYEYQGTSNAGTSSELDLEAELFDEEAEEALAAFWLELETL